MKAQREKFPLGAWAGTVAGLLLVLLASAAAEEGTGDARLRLVWPTPNLAFLEGREMTEYVQPTAAGTVESGLFGCVRNHGSRFHEGLDLKATQFDRRGEALDPVFAMLAGEVVHISTVAGHSSYGRYVVLEHPGLDPAITTLYAHLSRVEPGLKVGQRVEAGARLGIMGRSAAGYVIPKSQAHVHVEVGLRLSDRFQDWYEKQDFGSPNHHGNWNGMNLVGVDPLEFLRAASAGKLRQPRDFLWAQPVAVTLRLFTRGTPDFLRRYPELVAEPLREGEPVTAWEVDFTWNQVPIRWVARYAADGVVGTPGTLQVLAYDPQVLQSCRCRSSLEIEPGGKVKLGENLRTTLELVLGW